MGENLKWKRDENDMGKVNALVAEIFKLNADGKPIDVESMTKELSDGEKVELAYKLKRTVAYIQMQNSEPMVRKCYTCVHRNNIPGSAHSQCNCYKAEVFGDEHGIQKGWFFWPFDFDPVWLRFCDSYEEKHK